MNNKYTRRFAEKAEEIIAEYSSKPASPVSDRLIHRVRHAIMPNEKRNSLLLVEWGNILKEAKANAYAHMPKLEKTLEKMYYEFIRR